MRSADHNEALDGIRGIAVLLVMFSHLGILVFAGGFFGVDLFFVLSGFLITTLLLREYDGNAASVSMRNFYMRRILRLAPALLVLLAVYVVFSIATGSDSAAVSLRALLALFYVTNWVSTFAAVDLAHLGHTWSLSIEEQFYLVWPWALVGLLSRFRHRAVLAAVIAGFVALELAMRALYVSRDAPWYRIHFGMDARSDPLLIGCLLAVCLSYPPMRAAAVRHARAISVLAVIGCLYLAALVPIRDPFDVIIRRYHVWGLLGCELAIALVILYVAIGGQGALTSVLSWRPLAGIGRISYGLYLWHYPIFGVMQKVLKGRVDPANLVTVTLAIMLVFAVTLAVALASYRWIEEPALRLKRRFPPGDRSKLGPPPQLPHLAEGGSCTSTSLGTVIVSGKRQNPANFCG